MHASILFSLVNNRGKRTAHSTQNAPVLRPPRRSTLRAAAVREASSMDTSNYGIVGTNAPSPRSHDAATASSTPMYDELCEVIHQHCGSLGDDMCRQYEELQVGAINELILSECTDKVDRLLELLKVEGVELQSSGVHPPPLLVLAKLEKERFFYGMTRVWLKMIKGGADPHEEYNGESAHAVAHALGSPVLF
jgi:hypothetical protein